MKKSICSTFTLLIIATLFSCAVPYKVQTPAPERKQALKQSTLNAIQKMGNDGDWLVVRNVHQTDNLVSTIRNAPVSHAAILDLSKQVVVESNSKGVHITPLADFVGGAHRLILVSPKWATEASRKSAIEAAYGHLGKKYDYLGLVGINMSDRYYCSELAVAVYKPYIDRNEEFSHPIAPDQLYFYGKILYDSGAI